MKYLRHLTAVALLLTAMRPALAADVTFPPGARVGLTPLVGLAKAKAFSGFESEDQSVKVLVTELPANAYNEVKTALGANPVAPNGSTPQTIETAAGMAYYTVETAKDGANTVRRYSMMLSGGTFSGYVAVQVPDNATRDLFRRCGPPDVCVSGGPQGSPGRGAARADAVQAHRDRAISRMSARWRPAPPWSLPTAMKPAASSRRPSW